LGSEDFWRREMSGETIDLDRLSDENPLSLLERTLIAEYLFSRGYLMSDLKVLPPRVAKSLMEEACRFAALRLAGIGPWDIFRQKIGLNISLN
jgi:hypothetical protein